MTVQEQIIESSKNLTVPELDALVKQLEIVRNNKFILLDENEVMQIKYDNCRAIVELYQTNEKVKRMFDDMRTAERYVVHLDRSCDELEKTLPFSSDIVSHKLFCYDWDIRVPEVVDSLVTSFSEHGLDQLAWAYLYLFPEAVILPEIIINPDYTYSQWDYDNLTTFIQRTLNFGNLSRDLTLCKKHIDKIFKKE